MTTLHLNLNLNLPAFCHLYRTYVVTGVQISSTQPSQSDGSAAMDTRALQTSRTVCWRTHRALGCSM
jgi:hypothetical protein